MEYPQVLVVMPLYNARPFVRAAIESILTQTYLNFTLLVINDGSTDESELEAAKFKNKGVILWHQENQGPGIAMNRAINYAHDKQIQFIARIDSDDISLPNRLEKQILLFMKYPNSAACSANCYYIDPITENIIGTSTVSTSNPLIQWEIKHGLRGLIQPVCVFRTNSLYSIGGYRQQFILAEEVDVFLRLAESYELCNTSDFLAKIRLNPKSLSMKNVKKNILYQFYALDCASRRRKGQPEQDFTHFHEKINWQTRYRIWREEKVLQLWRESFQNHSLLTKCYAALVDPRRVAVRLLRALVN